MAECVSVDGLIQGRVDTPEYSKSKEEDGGPRDSATSTIHERGEPMEEEALDKEAETEETKESELMIVEDSSRRL